MRDHAARWHELRPRPPARPGVFPSSCLLLVGVIPRRRVAANKTFRLLSDNESVRDGDGAACGSWCRSYDVLSLCLCRVLNINRAEKCPEWNESVAAWSRGFVMMVISTVEEGRARLCSTTEKRMSVFGSALFSAPFQCLMSAGVCEATVNELESSGGGGGLKDLPVGGLTLTNCFYSFILSVNVTHQKTLCASLLWMSLIRQHNILREWSSPPLKCNQ